MLQQMFEVTAARFHAVTQTFAPLIDSRRRFRSSRSRIAILYTRSCITPQILQSTRLRSGLFGGHKSGVMNCGIERRRKSTVSHARTMHRRTILLEDNLSYCWQHVFRRQLISVIGATDLSPGLDENQLHALELGHSDRHHQRLAQRWTYGVVGQRQQCASLTTVAHKRGCQAERQ